MRAWILGLCVGWSTVAAAAPDYKAELSDGRRLLAAKDYAGAAAAFQRAGEARPGDALALSERSWALLLAGDFLGAERAAGEASIATRDPKLRAAVEYNLGRAEEALGKLDDARRAYALSLSLRDNAELAQRLAKLTADLVVPRALAGPFALPSDYCASLHMGSDECQVADDHVVAEDARFEADPVSRLKPPFQAITKIETRLDQQLQFPTANLAIEVGGQWFVVPGIGEAGAGHGGGHAIAARMVGTRLWIDWSSSIGRFGHSDETAVIVCGVTAGQPRCVGPLVTSRMEVTDYCGKTPDCTTKDTLDVAFRCRATLRGDVLELVDDRTRFHSDETGETVPPKLGACAKLPGAGTHKLAF